MTSATAIRRGEVSVQRMHKSFSLNGEPFDVFRDVTLHIRAGQSIAIVGPSGCAAAHPRRAGGARRR